MPRPGFFGVAVLHPRQHHSVGGLFRAASNFRANWLATVGAHFGDDEKALDIVNAASEVPLWEFENLADLAEKAPIGCKLIGVGGDPEIGPARTLDMFAHPDRALYLFADPAQGLSKRVQTQWCNEVITVATPRRAPLSLDAQGGIVMHHRFTTERLGREFVA